MSVFILSLLAFFLLIYFWIEQRRGYWTNRGFPSSKLIFPFGSLKGIGTEKSLCIGLDEFYKKFKGKGPAVGLFYFTKPTLLPIEPELIKSILVTNFDSFQDRLIYYNKADDPISAHLLALEGEFNFIA
jgi:cytochrome P450 family 6